MRAMIIVATLILAGCVNPYVNNFRYIPGSNLVMAREAGPPPAIPDVLEGVSPASDIASQEADGFFPIGYSDFSAAPGFVPRDGAVSQGQAIGADRVLVYSQYQGTVTTEIPITTPTQQTTFYNGTATAYGSDGSSATAYGSGTATTYGSQTQYFPISVSRYEFLAVYFVKVRLSFGALYKPVTQEQAQEVGTVDALQITVVVHGTPAAEAGLLPGDIVTEVDHAPFGNTDDFKSKVQADNGRFATLTVVRNGVTLQKRVALLSSAQSGDEGSSGPEGAPARGPTSAGSALDGSPVTVSSGDRTSAYNDNLSENDACRKLDALNKAFAAGTVTEQQFDAQFKGLTARCDGTP